MKHAARTMQRFMRVYPPIAALIAISTGTATFVGWVTGNITLTTFGTSLPSMTVPTALMSVLAGIALWASARASIARRLRTVARMCAGAVVGIAGVTVIEHTLGVALDVDALLDALGVSWPTVRPAPQTGLSFVALGVGLLSIRRDFRGWRLADHLALAAITVAILALLGYLFGVPSLYQVPKLPHLGMSIPTALIVLGLGLGILAVRRERSVIGIVLADDAGGAVARWLLGGLLVYPVVAVALITGARLHWYTLSFASALVVLVALAHGSRLVFASANRLSTVEAALRASEMRTRELIEQASAAIFLADLRGYYTDVNEAACRMLGYTRGELIGKSIVDLIPPDEVPLLAASKTRMERGITDVGEWRLRHKDGTYIPVEVSAKIFADGRWQAVVRDLTERKRTEAALALAAQAESALRAELESLMGAISASVGDGTSSDANAVLRAIAERGRVLTNATSAALGIGGAPGREFDRWVAVGMPDDVSQALARAPRVVGVFADVRAHGDVMRIPDITRHPAFRGLPTGHPMVASLLSVPIKHQDRTVGMLFFANKRDAPEFSEADERAALALANRVGPVVETATRYATETTLRVWLQSLIEQLPEGVIVLDERGHVKAMNRALLALARSDGGAVDLERLDLRDATGEPVPFGEQPLVRALAHGETVRERELVIRDPAGRMVPVMVSAGPVRDELDRTTGAIAVVTEISERKELERLRDEWVAVVAHDLRQPLNSILLWSDRLDALAIGDKQHAAVGRIRDAGWRLNRMIYDLLDAARIAAARLAVEPRTADLVHAVRAAVDNARVSHPNVTFELATPERELAWFDGDRVEQVLANLLSNAAKYRTAGAPIRVEVGSRDGVVEVAVINAGLPIAEAELQRLFSRFARTRHARESGIPGIGLGLYICKGLIEAQGGRIWAESAGGTNAFRFTLPRPPE